MLVAAKVTREPILPNAAPRMDVRTSRYEQKRDKNKVDFAKGLCRKNFQGFR